MRGSVSGGRVDLPRVVVLVLNYNASEDLERCLRSLLSTTYPNCRIVVLDNGSTDGSTKVPLALGVELHSYSENLGYCAAYNRAFRTVVGDADFVLLSNPDVVVPQDTIGKMVAAAGNDQRIGFVGPVQKHAGTLQVRSAGIRWSCGRLPRHVLRPGEPFDVLEGAFLLVRRLVLERVGGLDEALGLNLEDVDWQLRARAAGFRSVLAHDACIFHKQPSPLRVRVGAYYQARNACIVTARYCGEGALRRLRLRLALEAYAGRVIGRPRARYILEGLRDFERGITGMKAFL